MNFPVVNTQIWMLQRPRGEWSRTQKFADYLLAGLKAPEECGSQSCNVVVGMNRTGVETWKDNARGYQSDSIAFFVCLLRRNLLSVNRKLQNHCNMTIIHRIFIWNSCAINTKYTQVFKNISITSTNMNSTSYISGILIFNVSIKLG